MNGMKMPAGKYAGAGYEEKGIHSLRIQRDSRCAAGVHGEGTAGRWDDKCSVWQVTQMMKRVSYIDTSLR